MLYHCFFFCLHAYMFSIIFTFLLLFKLCTFYISWVRTNTSGVRSRALFVFNFFINNKAMDSTLFNQQLTKKYTNLLHNISFDTLNFPYIGIWGHQLEPRDLLHRSWAEMESLKDKVCCFYCCAMCKVGSFQLYTHFPTAHSDHVYFPTIFFLVSFFCFCMFLLFISVC
jgi:hypothetical protein